MQEAELDPSNEPDIVLVTRQFAEFCKVLSNPRRVLVLEELGSAERDVSSLTGSLQVSQSSISQHIAVLRAHKLIDERRAGRTVFYSLRNRELALWIADGLKFTGKELKGVQKEGDRQQPSSEDVLDIEEVRR